ncbi:hypothetical protein KCU65_g1885, partial [Aureobasidium melanogenum]
MTGPSILTRHGFITEQEALEVELDVIPRLHRRRESDSFRQKLQSSSSHIRDLISRHLQIPESEFVLDEPSAWIEGAFNICLGIELNKERYPHLPQTALIRFPMPFNIGEDFAPGAMDEKLRCEAATYIWMRENCPNIPLPRLLGMGFPGSQTDTTYTSADSYVQDTLSYQDQRMTHQMNSILDEDDGVHQLSALVGMRALLPHFFGKESRNGPFILSLPDLHASNIFVDTDWNITSIIDLENAPVVPVQTVHVPYWLTNQGVDQIHGPELELYKQQYDEFVNILEQEENTLARDHSYSQRLRQEWATGRLWYVMALSSTNGFPSIFEQHLQPRFFEEDFETHVQGQPLSRLWCEDVDSFIAKKLEDYEVYQNNVRSIFAAAKSEHDASQEDRGEEETTLDMQHNAEQEVAETL